MTSTTSLNAVSVFSYRAGMPSQVYKGPRDYLHFHCRAESNL